MAYDGSQACAPCEPALHLTHTLQPDSQTPCTLHLAPLCLCLGLCSSPPGPAKDDTLHLPFCYRTVPLRYDGTHSLNLKPRGLSIHRC